MKSTPVKADVIARTGGRKIGQVLIDEFRPVSWDAAEIAATAFDRWPGLDGLVLRIGEQVRNELRRHFRPEFLNRVDDIIVFRPLSREDLVQIVDIQLASLLGREGPAAGRRRTPASPADATRTPASTTRATEGTERR